VPLPAPLAGLLRPAAYPHAVARVQLVETHMSWILLTGEYAYKIKRPVHYPFADFRDAGHRAALCAEELRLNRRFAPSLYLSVETIHERDGLACVGGDGAVLETAVRMRQFDRSGELDVLVTADRASEGELARFGTSLAAIHDGLDRAAPDAPWLDTRATAHTLRRNLAECLLRVDPADRPIVRALRGPLARRLHALRPWLAARAAGGFVRECHGDLHLSNIVRIDGQLVPFDALEFEPAFRWIDTADECAFLCADLEGYRRPALATAFLNGYLEGSGDFELLRGLDLYVAHRALVRAKIMAIREAGDGAEHDRWRARARDYLEVARQALARPRPRLLLMHGLAGSGKTTIARELATTLGAAHVRSDVERKRLAGLDATARSGSGVGERLYAAEASERAYARLADCAEAALAGGRNVIVDAALLRRSQRARFAALGRRLGVHCAVIECRAPRAELGRRIRARAAQGRDASEADAAVLAWQFANVEPIEAAEGFALVTVDTTAADALGQALEALR
jgi:aminoglycoside phosphotransferase family enzyme/predicted kinase